MTFIESVTDVFINWFDCNYFRRFITEVQADKYWIGRKLSDSSFACPNVSLFRLIGKIFGAIDSKLVLDIGFGHGADLLECKRRGADVYGLDLNQAYVDNMIHLSRHHLSTFKAGVDKIPFDKSFDLIYSRDMINYLDDEEIKFFFNDCYSNIDNNGYLIIQFIEKDLICASANTRDDFNADFLLNYMDHKIFPKDNPIRFLLPSDIISMASDAGLKHIGSKRLIQSYDLNEHEFRIDKYLVFSHV